MSGGAGMAIDQNQLQRLSDLILQHDPTLFEAFTTLCQDQANYHNFFPPHLGRLDLDVARQIVSVNTPFCEMLGYTGSELTGRTLESLVHPDDLATLVDREKRLTRNFLPSYTLDIRLIGHEGQVVSSRIHVSMARDAVQTPIAWKVIVEAAAEHAGQNTLRSQVIEDARCLLWHAIVYDLGGPESESTSLGWETYYPPIDNLQRFLPLNVTPRVPYSVVFYLERPEEDRKRCDALAVEAIRAGRDYEQEFRVRAADGTCHWIQEKIRVKTLEAGRRWHLVAVCIDITDTKNLQQQLIEAQRLESLGRLAGGIAHDFNNLLTGIMGYTELAMVSFDLKSEEVAMLSQVQGAAERAAELTRQLLMYARRQIVEFTNLDINRVIRDTCDLLRRTIGAQYELVLLLTEEACLVHSNRTQIEQVLMNLVVNAHDAMPDGGRILIETQRVRLDSDYVGRHLGVSPGEYVMFSVSDTGVGIPPELQDQIFEPFFTTKEVGKGTGLGLATCYGIVKQSQGNIYVYSEAGKGTTIKVYLPMVAGIEAGPSIVETGSAPTGSATILLVDDEPMVRDAAARILRKYGYDVLEASNGVEALNIWSGLADRESTAGSSRGVGRGKIDLLLTDIVMPMMGGKELAQRILQADPDLRVLYMSGYTQNVISQSGVLKPGIALLPKPFSSATLLQKIDEVIHSAK